MGFQGEMTLLMPFGSFWVLGCPRSKSERRHVGGSQEARDDMDLDVTGLADPLGLPGDKGVTYVQVTF